MAREWQGEGHHYVQDPREAAEARGPVHDPPHRRPGDPPGLNRCDGHGDVAMAMAVAVAV